MSENQQEPNLMREDPRKSHSTMENQKEIDAESHSAMNDLKE